MSRRPILLAVMLSTRLQAASIGGLWALVAEPGQALYELLHYQQDSSTDTYHHVGVGAWLQTLGLTPADIRSIATAG